MFTSDYEAMKIYEFRSTDLIREATQDRLAAEASFCQSKSRPLHLGFAVVLGTLLISWGEKLKNMS